MDDQNQPIFSKAQLPSQSPTIIKSLNNWSKIILFTALEFIAISGSVYIGTQIGKTKATSNQSTNELQTLPFQLTIVPTISPTESNTTNINQNVKFTGTITEINNECWSDGTCSIEVNDKWIVAEIGAEHPPGSKIEIRGNLININFTQDTNKYIGKRVEIYAKQLNSSNFTIYGDTSYYIKLLE
jgi:hypothetical protein